MQAIFILLTACGHNMVTAARNPMKLYRKLRTIPASFPVFFFATIAMVTSSCGKSLFSSTSTGGLSTVPVTTGTPTPTSSVSATATPTATPTVGMFANPVTAQAPIATSGVTPTATPTPMTQAFAMVTNFNDAKVSVFARDTKTGRLTLKSEADAGESRGPKGIAITQDGRAAYVANHADGKIYQYTFDAAAGALAPMVPASVNEAAGGGTEMIATDPSGKYLFASNSRNGTITDYKMAGRTRSLKALTSLTLPQGSQPFGIAVDRSDRHVYVSDAGNGLIYTFSIDRSGELEPNGNGVPSLGSSTGHPAALVIDSAGKSLYATDATSGAVAVFSISRDKLKFTKLLAPVSTPSTAIDVAVTHAGSEPLLAEPLQSADTLQLLSIGSIADSTPSIAPSDKISAPTAVAADHNDHHLYTTNQGDGTISTFVFGACPTRHALCLEQTVPSENPPNSQSGPFWIVLMH
jgi:6-phosphogluconolactonase (cycloisomerase 2 family)